MVDNGFFWTLGTIFNLDNNPVLMHTCSVFTTILAIIFAYVTNRKFVFESKANTFETILKEIVEFFTARLFTLVLGEFILHYGVTYFNFDPRIAKIVVTIIIIVINYIFSKLWIFKK